MERLVYVVPGLSFFDQGYRGRVMHALGICEGFAAMGVEVTIIGGHKLSEYRDDIPGTVRVVELKEPRGVFKYLRWHLRLGAAIAAENRIAKFDTVIFRYAASMGLLISAMGVYLPASMTKVLEVNSFYYHWMRKGPKFLNSIIVWFEAFLVQRYDVLYLVSNTMLKDLRMTKFQPQKVVVPNGATTMELNARSDVTKHQRPRIVYFGTIMAYWDLRFVVNSILEANSSLDVEFVFVGDGAAKGYLVNEVGHLSNVTFYGQFERRFLSDYISETDILWYPPKTSADKSLTGGLSTKIFEYMSLSMPILCPMDGEITDIFQDRENAIFYDSGDPKSFVRSAALAMTDSELRRRVARQAYSDFCEKYSWLARMKTLGHFLEGVSER